MPYPHPINFHDLDEDAVVRTILEGTATQTGEDFFAALVENLSKEDYKQQFMIDSGEIPARDNSEFEGIFVSKDGRPVPVLMHRSTLLDDKGSTIGSMAFVTDMTEQKKSLALAGEIQKNLLPHESPRVQGLDIAGRNDTCDEIGTE